MHRKEEHQDEFADLHQRLLAPAQKAIQARFALERQPERQKVQRQKYRERKPRDPVQHRRDPQRAAAVFYRAPSQVPSHVSSQVTGHGSTTAATARRPSAVSTRPKKTAHASMRRSLSGSPSLKILRTPIEA